MAFASDAFAGMFDHPESWAANLVLGLEPCWLGPFHPFDVDSEKVEGLKARAEQHGDKDVRVVEGDFNREVVAHLASGDISSRRATFALFDLPSTHRKEWADHGSVLWYPMPVVGSADAPPRVPAWRQS